MYSSNAQADQRSRSCASAGSGSITPFFTGTREQRVEGVVLLGAVREGLAHLPDDRGMPLGEHAVRDQPVLVGEDHGRGLAEEGTALAPAGGVSGMRLTEYCGALGPPTEPHAALLFSSALGPAFPIAFALVRALVTSSAISRSSCATRVRYRARRGTGTMPDHHVPHLGQSAGLTLYGFEGTAHDPGADEEADEGVGDGVDVRLRMEVWTP
ncbi:hypothetical protein SALBM311S_06794 [Streptomyces alboniger]